MYNINPYVFNYGQNFFTNRFIENFIQLTYKSDMCSLNVRESHFFINAIKIACDNHILLK